MDAGLDVSSASFRCLSSAHRSLSGWYHL